MKNNNIEKYISFCKTEKYLPIFMQYWWLDSTAWKWNWNVILIENWWNIKAIFPYFINRRFKIFKTFSNPKLTQFLWPYIKYPEWQKVTSKLNFEKKILNQIISKIPKYDLYDQSFSANIKNYLPFYWKKFEETTRYTYIIDKLSSINNIYENFEWKIKTDIKKAEKLVKTISNNDIDSFYKLNKKSFDRQNIKIPYSINFIKNIDNECVKNNCRKIFFAVDEKNNLHAAIYIIWDNNSAYYLMWWWNPEFRNSWATTLLLWEAIKFSSTVTKSFNFEWSMVEPIERFFRAFWWKQTPYFRISKINSKLYLTLKYLSKLFKSD
jgi:hypothetical protein